MIAGSSFYKEGQYDSATYYLKKAVQSKSYYTKYGAYMRLADVARIQGRYSEALQYEDAYIAYKDSAMKEESPAKVIATLKDMFYHQSVYQYETFMSRYRLYILLLSIVLLLRSAALFGGTLQNNTKLNYHC